MNKQDLILIIFVILIGIIIFVAGKALSNDKATIANVYYDNKVVLSIDLSVRESKKYTVKGYKGDVIIEARENQIRVEKENSPLHLCSKQGWVSSSLESIVCLPNKIIIKIEANDNEVDAVVR